MTPSVVKWRQLSAATFKKWRGSTRALLLGLSALTVSILSSCSTLMPSDTPQTQGFAKVESQAQRNARVQHVEILPSNARIALGASIIYTAVAQAKDNVPVAGVAIGWRAYNSRNRELALSQGTFSPKTTGTYRIVATDGKHEAHTSLTVDDASTRNSASSLLPDRDSGWDDSSAGTAFEPGKQRGQEPLSARRDGLTQAGSRKPVREKAYDAGNRNFRVTVPVVHAPGRGIDLVIDLHYNSSLWHQSDSSMQFDIDADWPAPGWSLGFGKLVLLRTDNTSTEVMLVDADGARHPFSQRKRENDTIYRYSTDGTFIDLVYKVAFERFDGPGLRSILVSGQSKYPDGSVIDFTALGSSRTTLFPTRITDPNGNFVTITYKNNTGPQIETITDTLARFYRFHYDIDNRLTAITGPGLASSNNPRELIRLHYKPFSFSDVSGLFDRSSILVGQPPDPTWVIDGLYAPGAQSGYWFGDPDSFSPYGMLKKIPPQENLWVNFGSGRAPSA